MRQCAVQAKLRINSWHVSCEFSVVSKDAGCASQSIMLTSNCSSDNSLKPLSGKAGLSSLLRSA